MLHHDDRDRAIEEVERGIESGEPYTVEYRMVGATVGSSGSRTPP